MAYQRTRSGYTFQVDGLMLGDSRFVIYAAVEYSPALSEEERRRLMPIVRLELLLAIEGEEERGRRQGAELIHVGVAGDEAFHDFIGGWTHRRPSSSRPRVSARSRDAFLIPV